MPARKPLLSPDAAAFLRGEDPLPAAPVADSAAPATATQPPAGTGKPIRFTLDMDPEQHRQLRLEAASRGVRMSVIVREALDQWLSKS